MSDRLDAANKLLTIQEVAERLGMTEAWVIERTGARAKGDPIPSVKLGKYRRYKPALVDAWMDRHAENEPTDDEVEPGKAA